MSSKDLSDLISRIYDCTLDPGLWDGTLDECIKLLGCPIVQLALSDVANKRMLMSKERGIATRWGEAKNPYISYAENIVGREILIDEPVIASRERPISKIESSPLFREWAHSHGICDIAQINIFRSPTRFALLSFGRHETAGYFDDVAIDLIRVLIPHVRRAVTISNILYAKTVSETHLHGTLDALKLGIVLTNKNAEIVYANRTASTMMGNETSPLHQIQGHLEAERRPVSSKLKEAISIAARNEGGLAGTSLAVRLSNDDEKPVIARVLPLSQGSTRKPFASEVVAAVFVSTPMEESTCARAVAQAFRLTPAEVRVLGPILSGKTVPEVAAELGIATSTARTHLNNIFTRTGTSRQSELMKLAAQIALAQ